MAPLPQAAAVESVLAFVKAGSLRPASNPGFGHALKLSYNLMARERLSVTNHRKTLTYRYQLSDDVPKPTIGLYTALMDELSTDACFVAGLPSPPGVSLQMQTEILSKDLVEGDIDIVNTVTKLGKTISHTRTDFYCAATQRPLAFSSHVKYMPTGSFLLDFLFNNQHAFGLYQKLFVDRATPPPVYPTKNLFKDVIGSNLEYGNTRNGRFHITREHTNPFGAMHGGCHAMVMEQAGATFAKSELGHVDNVKLEAIHIDFIGAARGTVDVLCETIGHMENWNLIHVRVVLKNGERICSEGKLRFSKK